MESHDKRQFKALLYEQFARVGQELAECPQHLRTLRDLFYQRLSESLPDLIHLNGHPIERLPNTLNISIDGVVGEAVLAATPEIAATTDSACHAGSSARAYGHRDWLRARRGSGVAYPLDHLSI